MPASSLMGQWMPPACQISCKEVEKRRRRYRFRIKSPCLHLIIPQSDSTACHLEQVAGFPSVALADNNTHRRADTGPAHRAIATSTSPHKARQLTTLFSKSKSIEIAHEFIPWKHGSNPDGEPSTSADGANWALSCSTDISHSDGSIYRTPNTRQ